MTRAALVTIVVGALLAPALARADPADATAGLDLACADGTDVVGVRGCTPFGRWSQNLRFPSVFVDTGVRVRRTPILVYGAGVAQRASDIDVIYVYGYGFPAYRGGPMAYASEQGLKNVVADLESYSVTPAPLLKKLADEGKTFAQYDAERAGANQ